MNKKDKRKLCKIYDDLNDQINDIFHVIPNKYREYDIEYYKKVNEVIKELNQKVKDTVYNMLDELEAEDLYLEEFTDPHSGCYSYPNCDEAPLGCCVEHGLDAEPYGHRD